MFKYTATMSGKNFIPTKVLGNINLIDVNYHMLGAPISRRPGRYYEEGSLEFSDSSFTNLLATVVEIFDNKIHSIDEIEIHVLYEFEGQCNLEFTAEEITLISNLKAFLTITCYPA